MSSLAAGSVILDVVADVLEHHAGCCAAYAGGLVWALVDIVPLADVVLYGGPRRLRFRGGWPFGLGHLWLAVLLPGRLALSAVGAETAAATV